ncbi:MAG: hydroxymethylglutaryl-CoA reductase, degradative [Candidatus Micrarchaeia archaeon]
MTNFSGFYKLSVDERLKLLEGILDNEDISVLKNSGALSLDIADKMVENVIGTMHLPFAIATNFKINGKEVIIPVALEEPSVIAAACKAAKLCLPEGFTAEADDSVMIGQIQLAGFKDGKSAKEAKKSLESKKAEIVKIASSLYVGNQEFWGGVKNFIVKPITTGRGEMLICEFLIDVKDVMGANTINTILEAIAPTIEAYAGFGAKSRLKILSNLAIYRKVRARAVWKKETLGEEAVEGVLDGYEFAANDVFRCATHNKGIMNGVDAVAIACGQDWRAVEAGAHSYAATKGGKENSYSSLTKFEKDKNGNLVGSIEFPIAVGIFGGAIRTSPTAKIALKLLGAKNVKELEMAMACVGLANNFAALLALSTTGIQAGHMKLHARNIAVLAGALTPEEIDAVSDALFSSKNYSSEFGKEVLEKLRKGKK